MLTVPQAKFYGECKAKLGARKKGRARGEGHTERWKKTPKVHAFLHIIVDAFLLCGDAVVSAAWGDEDHMGRVKAICCTTRQVSQLSRHLLLMNTFTLNKLYQTQTILLKRIQCLSRMQQRGSLCEFVQKKAPWEQVLFEMHPDIAERAFTIHKDLKDEVRTYQPLMETTRLFDPPKYCSADSYNETNRRWGLAGTQSAQQAVNREEWDRCAGISAERVTSLEPVTMQSCEEIRDVLSHFEKCPLELSSDTGEEDGEWGDVEKLFGVEEDLDEESLDEISDLGYIDGINLDEMKSGSDSD